MNFFKYTVALAVLATSTVFAAGRDYEVTFHKEAPVQLTVTPAGEEFQLNSLNAGSKKEEPKGSIRIKESDTSLHVELDWWQGQLDELTDGKGSRLWVPAGTCRRFVTVPLQSDKPVVIPCWDGKPPYASFDAVTIRRLD